MVPLYIIRMHERLFSSITNFNNVCCSFLYIHFVFIRTLHNIINLLILIKCNTIFIVKYKNCVYNGNDVTKEAIMDKKKKIRKTPFYKNAGFYFVLVYAILTIAFIIQIATVNIIPMKYAIPIAILLLLILLGMYFLQMGKRISKSNRIFGKILIVILSIFLGVGNWYLFKTGSAFNKISGDDSETSVVSVVVMKDSPAKKVKDLVGKKIGTISTGDVATQKKALKDFTKDLGTDPTTVEYKSYKTYADDLYNGKVDAILLNEGSRGLIEDNHEDFDQKTRIIKKYVYKTKTEDLSKNVDVTKQPFNVYITGIDTYGTIATVSRSDVNMIATINPKTRQILLTSIPRDFYVPQTCQGGQKDKLTHTGIFGVQCTIDTAEKYFGIDLNYYVRVNFSSLIKIVDSLGGITVDNSAHAFTAFDGTYFAASKNLELNGKQALSYSRERKTFAEGDRERGRDQMRVLTGIIHKATSSAIVTNYSSIMDAIGDSFQSNMSNNEMNSLVKMQLGDMSGWDIKQISVNGVGAMQWSPANGFNSSVVIPNEKTVHNAVSLIKKVENGDKVTANDVKQQESIDAKAE